MISLNKGLFFENSLTVLPWGITRDAAWKIGSPTHYNLKDDFTRIKWEEPILGGLNCGILAYLPNDKKLSEIHIWRILDPKKYPRDPWYAYMNIFDHLLSEIGAPEMTPSKGNLYAPILTWHLDDCTLSLITGERFGDFTSLTIKKLKRSSTRR